MKTFKEILSEVEEPRGEDEMRFKDKHVIDKKKHPVANETQFTSSNKRAKRPADLADGEDEDMYESKSYPKPSGAPYIENERFWDLPKASLDYIRKDAHEAMKSMPDNKKNTQGKGNYADQINDAETVLAWRKKKGIKESYELDEEKFSSIDIQIAAKIAEKNAGNMTKAVKAIEAFKKGLSKHPDVVNILRLANEEVDEGDVDIISEVTYEGLPPTPELARFRANYGGTMQIGKYLDKLGEKKVREWFDRIWKEKNDLVKQMKKERRSTQFLQGHDKMIGAMRDWLQKSDPLDDMPSKDDPRWSKKKVTESKYTVNFAGKGWYTPERVGDKEMGPTPELDDFMKKTNNGKNIDKVFDADRNLAFDFRSRLGYEAKAYKMYSTKTYNAVMAQLKKVNAWFEKKDEEEYQARKKSGKTSARDGDKWWRDKLRWEK